jgi:ribosomal protein S18 acetylase RimI-like enzyme
VKVLRIRAATTEDEAFIQEMDLETTWASLDAGEQAEADRDEFRAALGPLNAPLFAQPASRVLIAEDDGRRLGMLWMGEREHPLTGRPEAWVFSVSVVPEARGLGLGRRLMEEAERLARAAGYATIGLLVSEHNTVAQRLYEKMGYETKQRLMRRRLASE